MISEVDIAIVRLSHHNRGVRKVAAQALCRLLPAERIREIQRALLLESDPKIAKWIALSLGRLGNPSSVPAIEATLQKTDDPDARDWLIVCLRMLSLDHGASSLRNLNLGSSTQALREAVVSSWENPRVGSDHIKSLLKAAEHQDAEVRRWAILALGTTPISVRAEWIIHGLVDEDFLVREWTACSLSKICDPDASDQLVVASTDLNPRVREWAIKALATDPDPEIARGLIKTYWDEPDSGIREAILQAVSSCTKEPLVKPFFGEVAERETNVVTLVTLIDSAARYDKGFGDPEITNPILRCCQRVGNPVLLDEFEMKIQPHLSKSDQKALARVLASPTLVTLAQSRDLKSMEHSMKVGIIIPLKEEFIHFKKIVGNLKDELDEETKQTYYRFTTPIGNGLEAECLVVLIGAMGTEIAATFSERLLTAFRPDVMVNIGIAGSLDDEIKLGDVIVATEVDLYLQNGKAASSSDELGFEIIPAGEPFKPDAALWQELMHFQLKSHNGFGNWRERSREDWLASTDETERKNLEAKHMIADETNIFEAIVASGPLLGASPEFAKWLKAKFNRNYKGLEMEAGGVALASHFNRVRARTLILRGISDFADERKKELDNIGKGSIRGVAVRNATRLLLEFLEKLDPAVLQVESQRQ